MDYFCTDVCVHFSFFYKLILYRVDTGVLFLILCVYHMKFDLCQFLILTYPSNVQQ